MFHFTDRQQIEETISEIQSRYLMSLDKKQLVKFETSSGSDLCRITFYRMLFTGKQHLEASVTHSLPTARAVWGALLHAGHTVS